MGIFTAFFGRGSKRRTKINEIKNLRGDINPEIALVYAKTLDLSFSVVKKSTHIKV